MKVAHIFRPIISSHQNVDIDEYADDDDDDDDVDDGVVIVETLLQCYELAA